MTEELKHLGGASFIFITLLLHSIVLMDRAGPAYLLRGGNGLNHRRLG